MEIGTIGDDVATKTNECGNEQRKRDTGGTMKKEDTYVQEQHNRNEGLFAEKGKRYCERCGALLKKSDAYLCSVCEVQDDG